MSRGTKQGDQGTKHQRGTKHLFGVKNSKMQIIPHSIQLDELFRMRYNLHFRIFHSKKVLGPPWFFDFSGPITRSESFPVIGSGTVRLSSPRRIELLPPEN
uniref:Uncharacterized protein n=1 Tax=Meloidogyne enterolobii TaxID=390850 RepID=A0A6V7W2I1_MELEN|nr:unnamed protein product [Meloidogyne enterolobii]